MREDEAVIVFDGVCGLCNRWVDFLLRHDRGRSFRFASMQSAAGRELMLRHGLDADDPASFLLVDRDGAWTDARAIRRVFAGLGGGWRVVDGLIGAVPSAVADRVYRFVARHRYRLFGRRSQCRLPTPDESSRFID
ncbi:membrane protein [Lysobacter bugurensis]|uniref:Membrane protein n=2 Tax=Cognatilysobacter bugurensis TaxID=543356 RepID=A0A918STB5_9GAMM|nr:membrane protein [Lysobacter bugurensis]